MMVELYRIAGWKCELAITLFGAGGQSGWSGGLLPGPGALLGSASQMIKDSQVVACAVKPGKAVRWLDIGGGTAPATGRLSEPRILVGSGTTERYRVEVVCDLTRLNNATVVPC